MRNKNKEVQYGTWEIGGPRHYYRENLIISHLKRFISNGKVLDVGCGTGSLVVKLALSGYEVHGIDMSDECLDVTSRRLKDLNLETKWEIKRGSALEIDYPDQSFDAVIAAEVLEHLDQDYLAVKEFHRVLRPGGYCLITVPSNQQLWDIWDEMAGHKRRYAKDDIIELFNKESLSLAKFFSWGFPVMRLYHRLVFLMWARHIEKKMKGEISADDAATRIGLSRWTTLFLGNVFRIDNLFSSLPWGIGILLITRKV